MANKEIKTVFKLDGEKEYKSAVKNINTELRVLSSEMKKTTASFNENDKSMRSLKAQNEILQKQYDKQREKVEYLKNAVKDSTEAYDKAKAKYEEIAAAQGKESAEAVKAAKAMKDAQEAVTSFTIQLNNSESALNKSEEALKTNQKELRKLSNVKVTDLVPEAAVEGVEKAEKVIKKTATAAKNLASAFGSAAAQAAKIGSATLEKTFKASAAALTAYSTAATAAGKAIVANTEEQNTAVSKLTASLGLTASEAEKYGDIMNSVYLDNFGDSFGDIADKIGLVRQQIKGLSDEELKEAVENGYSLEKVYGIDFSESLRGANSLINQFGITANEAYNLIAQGAEKGLNQNADLADQIAEYATYYSNLGFSAEDAFNIMAAGAESGVYQIDKINDAVKEFSIRAIDGSDTTANAFKALGVNASELPSIFAEGGEKSANAFRDILDRLAKVDNAVERDKIGVSLFGTQWEDLGEDAVLSLRNMSNSIDRTRNKLGEMSEATYTSFSETISRIGSSINLGDSFTEFSRQLSKSAEDISKAITGLFDPQTAEESKRNLQRLLSDLSVTLQSEMETIIPGFLEGFNTLIGTAGKMLPGAVATLLPYLVDGLNNLTQDFVKAIPELLPVVVEGGITLFTGLIGGLNEAIELLTPMLPGIIENVTTTLIESLPLLVETGFTLFVGIIKGLSEATPQIVTSIKELIPLLSDTIIENLPLLISAGIDLIGALISGIFEALPDLLAGVGDIAASMIDKLGEVDWLTEGENIFRGLGDGLVNVFSGALGLVDSLLGTEMKKYYDQISDFSFQVGAQLYKQQHAGEIEETKALGEADDIKASVILKTNQFIREGMSAKEAVDKARREVVKNDRQAYLYDRYVRNELETEEALNERYNTLQDTGQIGGYYATLGRTSGSANYYEQMGRAALAEKELDNTGATAQPKGATATGGGAGKKTTVNNTFINNSPKALTAYEQAQLNERQLEATKRYELA